MKRLNRVAGEVFNNLQGRLGVSFPRPTIVTTHEDAELEHEKVKKSLGIHTEHTRVCTSVETKGVPHGLMGSLVSYDDKEHVSLVFGPLKIHEVSNNLLVPLLQHEYSHLIAGLSDPAFHLAWCHFKEATLIPSQKGLRGVVKRLLYPQRHREADAYFADLFMESLCWIAPTQLSGVEAVQDHLNTISKFPRSDKYLNWYTHNTGARLYKKFGYDINVLVDPMSIMNERHPIVVELPACKSTMRKFRDEYKFNSGYSFNVQVITESGLEKVKTDAPRLQP